jgi:hypothetical protein
MAKTDLSQLKQTELRALVVLMVQARTLTNRDLRDLAGTDLSSGRGERLKTLGLVSIETVGRTNHYTLTDRGGRAMREPYASERLDAVGRFVFTLLSGLQTSLDRRGLSLGVFFQPGAASLVDEEAPSPAQPTVTEVKDRIRAAYASRPKAPGGWVDLAELRTDLGNLSRDDVDAALRALAREKGVRLAPFDNTRSLRPQDKEAALQLGDSPRHMIAMGRA